MAGIHITQPRPTIVHPLSKPEEKPVEKKPEENAPEKPEGGKPKVPGKPQ